LTSQGKSTAWQKKEKKTKTIDFVEKWERKRENLPTHKKIVYAYWVWAW
jgi:hypothetical protein